MISSNESPNANSAPATNAERICGNVTNRKVWNVEAPRSIEASSKLWPVRRRRATTLLKMTTMQNVVWPIATVQKPSWI